MNFKDIIFDLDDFDFTEKKGQGVYGEVYIATKKVIKESNKSEDSNESEIKEESKEEYAAKIINPYYLKTKRGQINFWRESMIMSQLNHPGIVKFAGINLHSFKDFEGLYPTILTEYH